MRAAYLRAWPGWTRSSFVDVTQERRWEVIALAQVVIGR